MAKGLYHKWLKPENIALIRGWKMKGLTDEQIANNIGVRRETIYDWAKRFPNISNALKIGKEAANYAVENKLFENAQKGNNTAMIFWLKNNYRSKYNDSNLTVEEIEMNKQRARKLKADAELSEYKLNEYKKAQKGQSSKIVIVDDIPDVKDDENGS